MWAYNEHNLLISENELVDLMADWISLHDDSPKNAEPKMMIDWQVELYNRGYQSKFVKINFFDVMQRLNLEKKISPIKTKFLYSFSKILFEDCERVILSTKHPIKECMFENCRFENGNGTTIIGSKLSKIIFNSELINFTFQNTQLNQCMFKKTSIKSTAFLSCTLSHCTFSHSSSAFSLLGCTFQDTNIDHCDFSGAIIFPINIINSTLTNSNLESSTWSHINGVFDNYLRLMLDNKANSETNFEIVEFNQSDKPNIIMLYAPGDGTTNADHLRKMYQNYDVNLILIQPSTGMNHAIFKNCHSISGIILPGGPNVPHLDSNDIRVNFEIELLKLACEHKIPTLGICRGHQLIGSFFGGKIIDLEKLEHHSEKALIKVKKNTIIYQYLTEKKLKWNSSNKKSNSCPIESKSKDDFFYYSSCAHGQVLLFNPDKNQIDKRVTIMAKAMDKTPEALSINGHILSYQHHHETYFATHSKEQTKIAKTLLKQYLGMVIQYYKDLRQTESSFKVLN